MQREKSLPEDFTSQTEVIISYDGFFQTVIIKKGTYLFHGSGALADNLVSFPLGKDFYKDYKFGTRQPNKIIAPNNPELTFRKVSSLLSEDFNISPSWYSSLEVAQGYSLEASESGYPACQQNCIHVYRATRDINLIDLSSINNLKMLINDFPDQNITGRNRSFKYVLRQMIGLETTKLTPESKLIRRSIRNYDIPFGNWVCSQLPQLLYQLYSKSFSYDGYAAPDLASDIHKRRAGRNVVKEFHSEIILCNPLQYMDRAYNHPADWQNDPISYNNLSSEISKLIIEMQKYKTTNTDFHAGNLLEHTIWIVLNVEELLIKNYYNFILNPVLHDKTVIAAFLHDIGKMGNLRIDGYRGHLFPRNQNKITYFSVPEHPRLGEEYLVGNNKFGFYKENNNNIIYDTSNSLNINDLFEELGLNYNSEDSVIITFLVSCHWELGNVLKRINSYIQTKYRQKGLSLSVLNMLRQNNDNIVNNSCINYLKFCINALERIESEIGITIYKGQNFTFLVNSLMLLSLSDVKASQPPGVGRLKVATNRNYLNLKSSVLPFLVNKSKVYRGSNIFEAVNYGPNEAGGLLVKEINRLLTAEFN